MIELDCSVPKKKYGAALTKVVEAVGLVIVKRYLLAPVKLYEAFKAYEPKDLTVEQKAYKFWHTVFATAVTDAMVRNRWALGTDKNAIEEVLTELFKSVFDRTRPGSFQPDNLIDPTSLPLYQEKLRELFPHYLAKIEPGHCKSDDAIRLDLDKSIRSSIWKVWHIDTAAFKEFETALDGLVAEGWQRVQAWRQHSGWIDYKLSGQPLFGQKDDSGITVQAVYTPLRCVIHEDLRVKSEGDEPADLQGPHDLDSKTKRIAHIGWLHETLADWLDIEGKDGARDPIRVIGGGPGSGKSTFSRVFASDVASQAGWNVCFVEMQHFRFKGDLEQNLSEHFASKRLGRCLGFDPLTAQSADQRPLLFVFDGLDELVRSDDAAEDVAKTFVRKAIGFLQKHNDGQMRAKAMILGRPAAVAPACKDAELDLSALVHVMPMNPLSAHALEIGYGRGGVELDPDLIRDPFQLASNDDRETYWENWCAASGETAKGKPTALEDRRLDEFTCEPLLFYLLIYSGFAMKGADEGEVNRNSIYREIFRRVHKRDKKLKKHEAARGIEKEDFFLLMECLAMAIWYGGGRTGSDDDFNTVFTALAEKTARRRLHGVQAATLENVAMQFYTRRDVGDDPGFEFIHKSFGEYLIGCALYRYASRLVTDDRGVDALALDWLKMTGRGVLSLDIIQFLRDEVRLNQPTDPDEFLSELLETLNLAVEKGFPAHELKSETWRQAETLQRNAAGSLLAVINAVYLTRRQGADEVVAPLDICWPEASAARQFLDMLHVTSAYGHPHGQLLSGFCFTGVIGRQGSRFQCDLSSLRLARVDLQGADLQHADLQQAYLLRAKLLGANLQRADLQGADLQRANLQQADLLRAKLLGANLQGADLQQAYLQQAYLLGAKLQQADLRGADLLRAKLLGANLQGADLQGADLQHADLQGADLQGAKLQQADLRGANLQRADLQGADLQRAMLRNSDASDAIILLASLASADLSLTRNLTQEQINSTFGDGGTKLPGGLNRPDHWPEQELGFVEADEQWRAWIRAQLAKENAEDDAEPAGTD
ncbi:pentapeptide repeat-containing protein [Roseibium litorale]|uniref:Pentapeptide repeat-containing protein n=1 Tax=Roseibium litorale TaxID=2803841 RepID=A0ABR9CI56_9HYPH|nr:pentapeptide repeat-containing protein [Roseibium litorale]MBD8890512.1 pentapeptide repeat-containing protein [Roseibium litorale]